MNKMNRKYINNENSLLKSFKKLSETVDALTKSFRNVQTISSTIKKTQLMANFPALKQILLIQKDLGFVMPKIIDIQKILPPIFENKTLDALTRRAKEMDTTAFKAFLKEWSWLLNSKSISYGDYCYGLYKKYGNRKFKEKLIRQFSTKKHLEIISKEMKVKFPQRYSIIKEGFKFHKERNYACAITLLLPHTEGILWDLGIKRDLVRGGYNSMNKKKKNTKWKLSNLSEQLFPEDEFHKIIVEDIFCIGFRNKVLHGRNIYRKKQKEITRWRSTLLILTLWRLSDEF